MSSAAAAPPVRPATVHRLPAPADPPGPAPAPDRPRGPRWLTVVFVSMAYGAAYLLAWFIVRALA